MFTETEPLTADQKKFWGILSQEHFSVKSPEQSTEIIFLAAYNKKQRQNTVKKIFFFSKGQMGNEMRYFQALCK